MARTKKGEESRAAAVGRKRQQPHDPVSAYKPDKRQKINDGDDSGDEDFVPLNFKADGGKNGKRGGNVAGDSKESGEVSASTRASRRIKKKSQATKQANMVAEKKTAALSPAAGHLKGIDSNAIFPKPLQTHVEEQMVLTGYPAENVLDKLIGPNRKSKQKLGKQAREFANEWKKGFCTTLRGYDFTKLQRLVNDADSFVTPLDLDKLMTKKPFGKALQEVHEQNSDMPAEAVLFELIKNRTFHRKACETMQDHLAKHEHAQAAHNTTFAQENSSLPGGTTPGSVSAPSPTSRTVSRQQSPNASEEGEISETEDDDDDEDDTSSDDDDDMYGYNTDGIVRLSDLSVEDQALQYRYFRLSDPGDSVHCLCCGERGHVQAHCPALICQYCHSGTHFSRGCPSHQKCERCRERGHNSKKCTKRSKPAGAPGDECDICGERGHAEEECSGLWMTFKPDAESIKKIPAKEMVVSCYNCGGKGHWGDDCSKLPDYVFKDIMHATWSAKNASKYIVGAEETLVSGKDVINGTGSVQAHQLAQLGDWM